MQDLYIASDHAGFVLKEEIIKHLQSNFSAIKVHDFGTNDSETSVDYPDYGYKVANKIAADGGIGILICGSGVGISIAANRVKGIRAALCFNSEMAQLARQHNNANILVLGARIIAQEVAMQCVDEFLRTDFAGGRHEQRVQKLG